MAAGNYQSSLLAMFGHEGGWSNHKDDPGGATNFGVTQRVFNVWRMLNGKPVESVRRITILEAGQIYKKQYWDVVKADFLPYGLDYALFDYAVNSGPVKAVKELQKALGIRSDGVIGAETELHIRNLSGQTEKIKSMIGRIQRDRLAFLKRLKHWKTFGRGWTRRVSEVREKSLKMADENSSLLDPNQLVMSGM